MEHRESEQRFSSRSAFLISALGIAVGTGNIWRFPRIAATNGGDEGAGAFLVAWVIFLFLWSIPLIIAEYIMGRKSRKGTVGAFVSLVGGKFAWMGGFVGLVTTAITFYYSVVVGWCIYYFIQMLSKPLPATTEASWSLWNNFQASALPLFFHGMAMAVGALAIWRGVSSIEKVNKVLIPTLLAIVVLSVIRALTLPGAWNGVAYLFTPQWSQLSNPKLWLEALTQNAWDTGAGWGLFLTYAIYIRRRYGIVKNAFVTAIGNNVVSLLAALMVFGTVFSILGMEGKTNGEILGIMKESGPAATGLTFIWMPQLFAKMPMGKLLAILFFLGLSFAGFSSLISMMELTSRNLIDLGLKRKTAIVCVAGVSYIMGIPSARNLDLFGNQDFVWGVALMISGIFVAVAVMRYGVTVLREKEVLQNENDWDLGAWWDRNIKFVVPMLGIALLIWWLSLSATVYAPDDWYNPLSPYSVMTCLVQWGAVLAVLWWLNSWMADRIQSQTD